MLIKSGQMLKDGMLLGLYCCAITKKGKIGLPDQLDNARRKLQIKEFWCHADPTGARIILCPSIYREYYLRNVVDFFPLNGTVEDHFRKFVFAASPKRVGPFGGISLPYDCRFHAGILEVTSVNVLGTGQWIEIYA